MKKRYLLLAGVLALSIVFGGCGKDKKNKDNAKEKIEQTVDAQTDPEDGKGGDVVSMQKDTAGIDKSKITKYLGTKTATSGEVVITNKTGREISEFYMRPTPTGSQTMEEDYEGDSWGADYVQENFTLKDKEQAILYYDRENTDSTGNKLKRYDFQVAFKDMDPSENCYFRELDVTVTEEYTLCIADGVPYVQYKNTATKKEESTLAAARARMGKTDSEDGTGTFAETTDSAETTETTDSAASDTANTDNSASSSDNNAGADGNPSDTGDGDGGGDEYVAPPEAPQSAADAASEYIGKTLDQMISDGRVGNPPSMEYDEDPETGNRIGYYYYDGYTVYTNQNDDGSETVTSVQ